MKRRVVSIMLMLCFISTNTLPLEGWRTTDLSKHSLQNGWELSLEFWVLLTKLPWKYFGRLKFKICDNEYSLLTNFRPVQHSIQKPGINCSANQMTVFYVKYNTRLKWVNLTQIGPFQGSQKLRVQKSLCWCQRNKTWREGLKTFEKY